MIAERTREFEETTWKAGGRYSNAERGGSEAVELRGLDCETGTRDWADASISPGGRAETDPTHSNGGRTVGKHEELSTTRSGGLPKAHTFLYTTNRLSDPRSER